MGHADTAALWAEPAAPLREELAALSLEHEALLAFINASPVGLAQTDLLGQVELVNAVIPMLLMPLTRQARLDNLFTALEPVAPSLAQRVAAFPHDHGVVCDDVRLTLSLPGEPLQVATLRLVKLDRARLMVALVDITAQVRAEQARQLAEDRLRLAMEAAQAGDWTLQLQPARLHLHWLGGLPPGVPPMPPQGWPLALVLACVHPEDRGLVLSSFARARRRQALWRCEFRLAAVADSPQRWLTMHGQPRHAPGQAALQWTGVLLDTSPQREAGALRERTRALDADNRALRESSRLKSQFLSAMSHELRTPLTSVIGFTELMRGGVAVAGTPQFDDCLEHIAGNGRHLLQIINDVLDLAKIEADRMEFVTAPVDLRELVFQVRNALVPQSQAKGLVLRVEVADGLADLKLDPTRLRQVLFNLLSNAVKFTPAGGQVEVRAWPADAGCFVLEVADTGIGIRESDLPRLFVEFQQLEAGHDRRHVGTGLGLALTRRLVQAQGGEITVRSSFGQGSVFRLRMPRVHAPAAPQADSAG